MLGLLWSKLHKIHVFILMLFSNISVQYKENMLANKHAKITTMDSISKVKCQLWLGFLCPHIFAHTPCPSPIHIARKDLNLHLKSAEVQLKWRRWLSIISCMNGLFAGLPVFSCIVPSHALCQIRHVPGPVLWLDPGRIPLPWQCLALELSSLRLSWPRFC